MNWKTHSEITEGSHAFLSASKYSWLNYDDEKLKQTYLNHLATLRGTELHEFASYCIKMKQKLLDIPETLNMFVNDAIDRGMKSEQKLVYSDLCYGTADAIALDEFSVLHISDLKTGTHKASMPQLEVYAALFCLDYGLDPGRDINAYELKIYQNNSINLYTPTRDRIMHVRDRIIEADKLLRELT